MKEEMKVNCIDQWVCGWINICIHVNCVKSFTVLWTRTNIVLGREYQFEFTVGTIASMHQLHQHPQRLCLRSQWTWVPTEKSSRRRLTSWTSDGYSPVKPVHRVLEPSHFTLVRVIVAELLHFVLEALHSLLQLFGQINHALIHKAPVHLRYRLGNPRQLSRAMQVLVVKRRVFVNRSWGAAFDVRVDRRPLVVPQETSWLGWVSRNQTMGTGFLRPS